MLSSLMVRREKERADWREGSRRRMSVQRLRAGAETLHELRLLPKPEAGRASSHR